MASAPLVTPRPAAAATRAGIIIALVLAALLATLTASEFTSSVESLVVVTAMEARRDGHWLAPTLDGEPRVRKPPLASWIVAASITPGTVARLDDADAAVREAAFRRLTWQARLPSALAAALTLIATYALAQTLLNDPRRAVTTTLVAGTTAMLLFETRQALLDPHLLLWTTVANLALAKLTFDRAGPRVRWALVSGAALGLGMMAKGPVALLMSLAPFALFAVWRRWRRRDEPQAQGWRRTLELSAIAVGVGATVGLAWFAWTALQHPAAWHVWVMDVTRSDPAEAARSPWYAYAMLPALLFPWTAFFILGLAAVIDDLRRRHLEDDGDDDRRERLVLLLLLVAVPLVVLSVVRDRKNRYLLPLLAPCAMIAAHGIDAAVRRLAARPRGAVLAAHWLIVVAVAVTTTLLPAGDAWVSLRSASVVVAVALAVIVLAAATWSLRRPRVTATLTAALMLGGFVGWMMFYRTTAESRSGMHALAARIRAELPGAVVFRLNDFDGRKQPTPELSLYLNRPRPPANNPRTAPRPTAGVPQVIVALMREDELAAPPAPPRRGWREFARVPRGKGTWLAYVRGDAPANASKPGATTTNTATTATATTSTATTATATTPTAMTATATTRDVHGAKVAVPAE